MPAILNHQAVDSEMDKVALGRRLRETRNERGLKQREVAAVLGVSPVGYGHYERGEHEIKLADLFKLADFYQLPVCELLPQDQQLRDGDPTLERTIHLLATLGPEDRVLVESIVRAIAEHRRREPETTAEQRGPRR